MSGTPVENRIADLWSLFEFLNPGMLGAARVFKTLGTSEEGESGRSLIARAVRPFILRRTKEEVAPELPEKLEQTIYVELEPKERKRYDDLRDHYRAALLGRIDKEGIAKSKIQILEALLQTSAGGVSLRAARREARRRESSSKFDLLIPQLVEIVAEGHKALVFSQFTSLLALLKPQLDREQGRLRVSRWADARSRGARHAVPDRPGVRRVSHQPQGRRPRSQPHGGGLRVPARSVVESGGRSAGDRPDAPHRPDAAGVRVAAHRARYGRGEGAGAAAVEARSRRGDHWRRQ